MKFLGLLLGVFSLSLLAKAQSGKTPVAGLSAHKPYVETISIAQTEGVSIGHLDSLYVSAVHADSCKAVFKPGKEQDDFIEAYTNFLQDLGNYLKKNNFMWGQPTRGWNRIYFRSDGAVDYYLFSFKTDIDNEKMVKFKELLRAYVAHKKINVSAPTRFAQCSPVVYMDK
jgi:hypothetical protein